MELTFEDTMTKLDAIIAQLDSARQRPKQPRLDSLSHDPDEAALAKYEALVDLKSLLEMQFQEYSSQAREFLDPHEDQSLRGDFRQDELDSANGQVFNDIDRLTIPLVGVPGATSQQPLNVAGDDALNIMITQGDGVSAPGVALYPNDDLKQNISEMLNIDFDQLIGEVSKSVGEVEMPLRVEEHHVVTTEHKGQKRPPYYKYTETVADVEPSGDGKKPLVNVLSKKYKEGDLFDAQNDKLRWVEMMQRPLKGVSSQRPTTLDGFMHDAENGDVKVNVTTKTNIVNVFTFNIFVKNGTTGTGTGPEDGSFSVVKEAPVRTNIQTTANIESSDESGGSPVSSISLYQYKANTKASEDEVKGGAAEMEKWLKILLNHQAYGDGSNIVAEAVLKDASLQQLPEARTGAAAAASSTGLYHRRGEDTTHKPFPSQILGYKTDMNGDLIVEGTNSKISPTTSSPPKAQRGLIETLAGSPIPTILAGIAAVSPAVLTVLGGKRRKKRELKDVDIPDQWLSFLLGTRYGSTTEKTSEDTSTTTTTRRPIYQPLINASQKVGYQPIQFEPLSVMKTTVSTTASTASMTSTSTPEIKYEPLVILSTTSDPVFESLVAKRNAAFSNLKSSASSILSQRRTEVAPTNSVVKKESNPKKVDNLMKHWTALYKSVKTGDNPPVKYFFPVETSTTTSTTTTMTTTTTTTTTSTTTAPKEMPLMEEQPQGSKWDLLSTSFPPVKESFFPHMNPIKIIDEAVAVSTSTSTEVNVVPTGDKPSKPTKMSTNVPPSLWLTAKDILNNLGTKLAFNGLHHQNALESQTNSPIVIIPVEDESEKPKVNVQALKPIVSQNPITFINMSGRPQRPKPPSQTAMNFEVEKPPSKLFVESYFAKNNVTLLHKRKDSISTATTTTSTTTTEVPDIINFNLETSTVGLRKPSWQASSQPNKGIGEVQELQIPVPVNIVSEVVHTDLTPEVLPVLMEKISSVSNYQKQPPPQKTDPNSQESSMEQLDYSPMSAPGSQVPNSYESYDEVPNNQLVDTLKMQLKHSPLTHAIDKGQWVYEKRRPNKGQILQWIKNLASDIEPTRKIPTTLETTTTTLATTTTVRSTTTMTSTRRTSTSTIYPILRRVTARTTPTTLKTTTTTTTTAAPSTVSQKKSLGEFVASALAQSAAPLAGLSAATIAYGAAAMLPVWLPLALGKKRRKRRRKRHIADPLHAIDFHKLNQKFN